MSSKTRAHRINEILAHPGGVNCIRIGRRSGKVLVSGGEDKKVNVYTTEKAYAVKTLLGHTSPVESVAFDSMETAVIAGSAGGTLKIWDVEESKLTRTLAGHNNSVTCIDFHPYGEFFASGSQDTVIKVWDIRRKGCIQTYKGHTKGVQVAKFSPDGRWVASGGEDGVVKIWDLTAGKQLQEFRLHEGPVTSMDFHPNEFLMATGSHDGTCKFWDLETFQMVSSTDTTELSKVKGISFSPDGRALIAAYSDSLKSWGWEPSRHYDTVPISWGTFGDMHIIADQIVSCSRSVEDESKFLVWLFTLPKIKPFSDFPDENFVESKEPDSRNSKFVKKDSVDSENFNLQNVDPSTFQVVKKPPTQTQTQTHNTSNTNAPLTAFSSQPNIPEIISKVEKSEKVEKPVVKVLEYGKSTFSGGFIPTAKLRDRPLGLDPSHDFLIQPPPKSAFAENIPIDANMLADDLLSPHLIVCSVLNMRLTNLKAIRTSWANKGADSKAVLDVLDSIQQITDPSVLVDFLQVLMLKEDLLTLDVCVSILPLLYQLTKSPYEAYRIVSINTTCKLAKSFGPLIKTIRETMPSTRGVDLMAEERIEKCNNCVTLFSEIKALLPHMKKQSSTMRSAVSDLLSALKPYLPE